VYPDRRLGAAADRLGRPCERLEVQGRAERAVVAASAQAARFGDPQAGLIGPTVEVLNSSPKCQARRVPGGPSGC
jgi:hypothetical protein